ncbi:MAG: GIY-YIG nuclease family protein [Candidatus Omnitrophota bacterium]|nr:GIY-YIG nuclease family protein [Candidatus Omnitrophota bacterium]
MFYVYVLRSLKNNKRYVGSTQLLPEERLKQHNQGSNTWTKQNGPFRLIYSESYPTNSEARKRERFLKSGVGRKFLDDMLDNTGD